MYTAMSLILTLSPELLLGGGCVLLHCTVAGPLFVRTLLMFVGIITFSLFLTKDWMSGLVLFSTFVNTSEGKTRNEIARSKCAQLSTGGAILQNDRHWQFLVLLPFGHLTKCVQSFHLCPCGRGLLGLWVWFSSVWWGCTGSLLLFSHLWAQKHSRPRCVSGCWHCSCYCVSSLNVE